jgi:hypothetical protein
MEANQFDDIARSITASPSRRVLFRGVLGASLGLSTLNLLEAAEAKKKHKNRKKKKQQQQPVLNAFGCVDVGQPCRGDSALCCSGICEGLAPKKGKPDTSVCVAHNTGPCTVDTNACELGVEVPCNPNLPRTVCSITTGNAAFCAALTGEGVRPNCRACTKDTDCQSEFGPGAACVVQGGVCTGLCLATGRTACLPPAA